MPARILKHYQLIIVSFLLIAISSNVYAQDEPLFSPAQDYFLDAQVDNLSPFVGQQITYTLQFYAASVPEFTLQEPDFVGFWRGEQTTGRTIENIGGRQYSVTSTTIILYPTFGGRSEIDSAVLIIPETVFSDRITLIAPDFDLNVRDLPESGSADFSGAVGRFSIDVAIQPTTVTLGNPVSLRYRISGAGNFEQMPPPDLNLPPNWRAYRSMGGSEVRTVAGGQLSEVTYEWQLVPDVSGTTEFPPFRLVYFDPIEETYRTAESVPVRIDVFPAGDMREIPDLETIGGQTAALPVKPAPEVFTVSAPLPAVGFWLMWLLPPSLAGAVWGGLNWRRWRQEQMRLRRQANALQRARKRLEAALKAEDQSARVYPLVYDAICVYLSDKFITTVQNMGDAGDVLREHGLDDAYREAVVDVMQIAQDGRYAPAGVIDGDKLLRRAAEVLTRLDDAIDARRLQHEAVNA